MSSRLVRRMSVSSLVRRVNTLDQKFHPAPLIIDAGKAKEELLQMLEMQMAKHEENEEEEQETEWTPEQEQFAKEFDALLEEKTERMLRENNIKLINC